MKQLCYIEIKRLLVRHMEFVLKERVRRDAWYYFVPPYMKRDVSSQQSLATEILESSLVYNVSQRILVLFLKKQNATFNSSNLARQHNFSNLEVKLICPL